MSLTMFCATRVAARWLRSFAPTLDWFPFAYIKSICIYDTNYGLMCAREVYMPVEDEVFVLKQEESCPASLHLPVSENEVLYN